MTSPLTKNHKKKEEYGWQWQSKWNTETIFLKDKCKTWKINKCLINAFDIIETTNDVFHILDCFEWLTIEDKVFAAKSWWIIHKSWNFSSSFIMMQMSFLLKYYCLKRMVKQHVLYFGSVILHATYFGSVNFMLLYISVFGFCLWISIIYYVSFYPNDIYACRNF